MFNARTPMYLRGISPGVETVDQETRKVLTLDFLIQPFTRAQADDLGIGADLFEGNSGNPNDLVISAKLRITPPLQRMSMYSTGDPDLPPMVKLDAVEVAKHIAVRADKDGPIFAATLTLKMRYPSGDDLLRVMSAYTEQVWLLLEEEQGRLPMGDGDQKPRRAKKAKATDATEQEAVGAAAGEASA